MNMNLLIKYSKLKYIPVIQNIFCNYFTNIFKYIQFECPDGSLKGKFISSPEKLSTPKTEHMTKPIFILIPLILSVLVQYSASSQGVIKVETDARLVSQTGSYWVLDNGSFTLTNHSEIYPAELANLTIKPGASLTIQPESYLTVTETLTNDAGNSGLIIGSNAAGNGSLIHVTDNVNATVKRYITGSLDLAIFKYHFVSVPLTASASPTSNLFSGSYLFNFSESTNSWVHMGPSSTEPWTSPAAI
jgi:hypothetical protein